MNYPRTVVLEDKKLKSFLEQKRDLILEGRAISEDIEKEEVVMQGIDDLIQKKEKEVDIADLNVEAEEVTKEFNAAVQRMEDIKKRIYERMKAKMDPELAQQYEAAKKAKEDLEIARNKIALNVQKINDRVIPLARKLLTPHLQNKYEDFETTQLDKDGKIVGVIFSHLNDFEKRFDAKAKK